jgi:hypothetical protein
LLKTIKVNRSAIFAIAGATVHLRTAGLHIPSLADNPVLSRDPQVTRSSGEIDSLGNLEAGSTGSDLGRRPDYGEACLYRESTCKP